MPTDEANKSNEARNQPQLLLLNCSEEERLRNLGVLPALRQSNTSSLPKHKRDDDPFVERSPDLQRNLFTPYTQDHPVDGHSSLRQDLQPAAKGTIKQDFRLLGPNEGPQQDTTKVRNGQTNQTNFGAPGTSYQRDPMPYSSFSSNKKDFLLQNLHDVVESSKAQGNLPVSTRTVLYDPVTHELTKYAHEASTPEVTVKENAIKPHYSSEKSFLAPIDGDKELLRGSDALPWTDRPVHIQNIVSPLAIHADVPPLPRPSTAQIPPPGLGFDTPDIWSMQPQPRKSGRSLEDAESWFMKKSRGEEGLQLQLYPDTTKTIQTLKQNGDMSTGLDQLKIDSSNKDSSIQGGIRVENSADGETAKALFQPAFENLVSYLENPSKPEYFGQFARVPEWCIDKSQDGSLSFFGDWGVPPSRVGRDPRYRPTFHEGRFTVFEELDRRGSRDGLGRRLH